MTWVAKFGGSLQHKSTQNIYLKLATVTLEIAFPGVGDDSVTSNIIRAEMAFLEGSH